MWAKTESSLGLTTSPGGGLGGGRAAFDIAPAPPGTGLNNGSAVEGVMGLVPAGTGLNNGRAAGSWSIYCFLNRSRRRSPAPPRTGLNGNRAA